MADHGTEFQVIIGYERKSGEDTLISRRCGLYGYKK